jgi:hypothetical protein
MRRELVDLIDPDKAIEFFQETQGWDPETTRQQVLTPLEDSSLIATDHADPNSIMCYQIPGSITKNGKPILGGLDIDASDFTFMAKIYPKDVAAAPAETEPVTGVALPYVSSAISNGHDGGARGWERAVAVAIETERYAAVQGYPIRVDPKDVYQAALRLSLGEG